MLISYLIELSQFDKDIIYTLYQEYQFILISLQTYAKTRALEKKKA